MRWRLVSDGSGHDYCIPSHLSDEFDEWVEEVESELKLTSRDFSAYRLGGCPGQLEFENPIYRGRIWAKRLKEKETK